MLKKIVVIVLAFVMILSLAACGNKNSYEFGPVSGGANANDQVTNNGSFVVQKGDYIYYINSVEATTAENKFNGGVSGNLMRANLDGSNPTVILPKLITNTSETGLYILGEWIYFTSPCDEVNADGKIQNTYLDVFKVKLDGTSATKLVTLGSTAYKMTFMEDNGVVYIVYVDGGVIYSIDTTAKEAKKKAIVENYSSYVFEGNTIYYTQNALKDAEKKVYDRYTAVYGMSANGEAKVLFDGNTASNVKYKITLHSFQGGRLYYLKNDSVLTLENALYSRKVDGLNASNDEKRATTVSAAAGSYLTYNFGGYEGIIISNSTTGVAFVGTPATNSNGKYEVLKSGTVTLAAVIDNFVYYIDTATANDFKVYRLDVNKALTTDEDVKAEQIMLISEKTEDKDAVYDGIYSSNFKSFAALNGNIYYYSSKSENARYLYMYEVKTGKIVEIGING